MSESTVRKRTQADLIQYIKNNSVNGMLTESLMDIAEKLGYSNATIHRTLKSLEAKGIVRIIPSEKAAKPNTIIYQGPIQEAKDILEEGPKVIQHLENAVVEVSSYIQEAIRVIEKLQNDLNTENSFRNRVVNMVDFDEDHYMMVVRK